MSAFDQLGHHTPANQEKSKWVPRPEMTPQRIDRGWQQHKEQGTKRAVSQKHWSQSRPHDEADPKKGRTEGKVKPGKIQVSIDWSTMGIQKPVSKLDSCLPSSRLDASGPSVKSTMTKVTQKHASASRTGTCPEGKLSRNPNAQLGDPEKREIKDKLHRWIEARVKHLEPAGYMEEINSLRYFRRNAGIFALWIVAIADWGRKYMDAGFKYPISVFPQFLSTPLPESHQGGAQVPVRLPQVNTPGGDKRLKCREAWKWLVSVLQFWGDKASSTDGLVYGGCECPVSTLAEYVLNTINPGLDPGSKVSWDDVVTRTPWLSKRLYGMTAAQETMVRHQALLVPGKSSDLEVVLERKYSEEVLRSKGWEKLVVENPPIPGRKPVTPSGLPKIGRGDTLKLHLKRTSRGEGWSIDMRGLGPNVGHPSPANQETDKPPQESEQMVRPGCSPLTSELLALDEKLTEVLDYEDVVENEASMPDPEITQAVAHIPKVDALADVEMQESLPPPGLEPKVSKSGYDVNLVRSNPTELGLTSLVMAWENEMLDGATSRTPGAGWPGTNEDPGHTENN